MKSSNDYKNHFENSKFEQPSAYFMTNTLNNKMSPQKRNKSHHIDPIFVTSTEPSLLDIKQKQINNENLIRKYNQIDSGQPVHVKSFSQQRSDKLILKKRERFRSQNPRPQELSGIEYQDSNGIGGVATITTTTTTTNATNFKQRLKQSTNKFKDKMKTNCDLIDEHMSNFEWLMQLKTQQLQKNMHGMFLKNERKKLLNSHSKCLNQIEVNGEDLCISPSKSNNIGLQKTSSPNANEFDFIIQQEAYLNQKIQRDANQKQDITNLQSSFTNESTAEDKIILKLNQQANKLTMHNQNKQSNVRVNKHSQALTSPLSQIRKEVQAYNEDFCLPYLKPLRTFNNKTKIYLLNKQKVKKSNNLRDNSITSNYNNGSKISQYTSSHEVSLSPKANIQRRGIDSNINLNQAEHQSSPFIQTTLNPHLFKSSYRHLSFRK